MNVILTLYDRLRFALKIFWLMAMMLRTDVTITEKASQKRMILKIAMKTMMLLFLLLYLLPFVMTLMTATMLMVMTAMQLTEVFLLLRR